MAFLLATCLGQMVQLINLTLGTVEQIYLIRHGHSLEAEAIFRINDCYFETLATFRCPLLAYVYLGQIMYIMHIHVFPSYVFLVNYSVNLIKIVAKLQKGTSRPKQQP